MINRCFYPFLLFIFFKALLLAGDLYIKHPSIPQEIWDEAKPYFLPDGHPIKEKIDALFEKKRLINSQELLKNEGFLFLKAKEELHVAIHPKLEGYVLKFYLDIHDIKKRFIKLKLNDDYISELRLWLLRIKGRERIEEIINKYQLNQHIKVPQKWIYPLPLDPAPTGPFPKYFLLVEENMATVDREENERCYLEEMTADLLRAFYLILREGIFYDSIYIDNNPFCKDGKIAFVDTEEYDRKPVLYEKLLPYLTTENQKLLQEFLKQDFKPELQPNQK